MVAKPSVRAISGITFGIAVFALLIKINSTENINPNSNNEFQNEKNATVSRSDPDFGISLPKQLSKDHIEIRIIQTVIEKFAAILSSHHNESIRRYKRGNFLPSTLNGNSSKLVMIENQLNRMKEQLAHLNSSVSLSTEDKSRISILETTIKELQTTLDSFQKEYSGTIQVIINKLETSILIGMVQSIKSGQFSFAEEQLQLSDDSIYKQVVQKVYDHQVKNIDFLLRFGGSFTDLEKKFKLYEAIYHEIRNSGHIDIEVLLRLGQSLRKGILEEATDLLMDKCRLLISTLWAENQNASVTLITDAFLKNESWPIVKQIKDEIHRSRGLKFLGNIYKEVIEKVIDKLSLKDILTNAGQHLNITEEQIIIHEGIINKLERNGSLYDDSVMPLVRQMKITWDDSGFNNEDWRYRYKIIINKLPRSLRNIVLSSSSILCIKNTRYNEYLYAADSKYKVERYQQVFVGIPKYKHELSEFKWIINFNEDFSIKIRNLRYHELLTFSSSNGIYYATIDSDVRFYAWKVLVDGEGVHLRYYDRKNNDLYVNDDKRDEHMRYVYVTISEDKTSYHSKWELVDCSDIS